MAIKENKQILAISLNNDTTTKLKYVVDDLSKKLNIDLTKSQAITILINDYGKKATAQPKESKQQRQTNTGLNYQAQVLALKDKLSVSYPKLAEIIGIPTTTIKKYAYGEQSPNGENETKLNNALKRYGIK